MLTRNDFKNLQFKRKGKGLKGEKYARDQN